MYFDLQPKACKKDLYDLDVEFQKLSNFVLGRRARAPLIVVKGSRRMGKTSLCLTTLNEAGVPYLILDGSEFADKRKIKREEFLQMLERDLNRAVKKKAGEKVLNLLRGIRWLRIDSEPPFIHFEWGRVVKEFSFLDIVYRLNEFKRFLLVLDEAQEFRKLVGYKLQGPMAHIYDHVDNVQMIVTGSQVGLLRDFLQEDNPKAPLFGRGAVEVKILKITDEFAIDFLTKGFGQAGIKPDPEILERATKKLGGAVGWLTLFGSMSVEAGKPTEEVLDKVVKKATEIELQELQNFLETSRASERYKRILESAARLERAGWKTIKEDLELKERKRIGNQIFSGLVKNLVDADWLAKSEDGTYSVGSRILASALRGS